MTPRLTSLLFLFALCSTSLQAQYIYTFAGDGHGANTGIGYYLGDGGLAKSAELNAPSGVAFDGAGNIYIADKSNNVVRKVNTMGIISTFAGTSLAGYAGDHGMASSARLNQPHGVAADADGNVYISDFNNNVIRKVDIYGRISTYAGSGSPGYSGDEGPATAAEMHNPAGIAVDTLGNLYIADAANHVIRQVSAAGLITTIAGTGVAGFSGDSSLAIYGQLNYPLAVAVDPYNQVYIADYLNNRVRRIDTMGVMTTFAGNGTVGYSGNGHNATMAQLHNPAGVSVFSFGNVYIADQANNAIRLVNSSGIISTYAGSYTNGYIGDGGPANLAQISSPKGIAVDGLNRLFIADYDNNVVRVVQTTKTAVNNLAASSGIKVFPNPSNGSFSVVIPSPAEGTTVSLTDVLGRIINSQEVKTGNNTISFNDVPSGNYIVVITAGGDTYREKVAVW